MTELKNEQNIIITPQDTKKDFSLKDSFRVKIKDYEIGLFKKIIEFFNSTGDSIIFLLQKKGLTLIPGFKFSKNYLKFFLPADCFDTFICEKDISFEFNSKDIKAIATRISATRSRSARNTDSITIYFEDKNNTIVFENLKERESHPHKFFLRIMSIDEMKSLKDSLFDFNLRFIEFKNTKYLSKFGITSNILKEAVKDMRKLDFSHFKIDICKNSITSKILITVDSEKHNYINNIPMDNLDSLNIIESQQGKFNLNLCYFLFNKFSSNNIISKLYLTNGQFLKLKFKFPNESLIKCFIAPYKKEPEFNQDEEEHLTFDPQNVLEKFKDNTALKTKLTKSKKKETRLKKPKKKLPSDPSKFLSQFRDGRKKKLIHKQSFITRSGNIIRSKMGEKYSKERVKKAKDKKREKRKNEKEFKEKQKIENQ